MWMTQEEVKVRCQEGCEPISSDKNLRLMRERNEDWGESQERQEIDLGGCATYIFILDRNGMF